MRPKVGTWGQELEREDAGTNNSNFISTEAARVWARRRRANQQRKTIVNIMPRGLPPSRNFNVVSLHSYIYSSQVCMIEYQLLTGFDT